MRNSIDGSPPPSLSPSGAQGVPQSNIGGSTPLPLPSRTPSTRSTPGLLGGLQARSNASAEGSRLSGAVAPRAALPTPAAKESTAAGHAESFARLGTTHIAKMTSPKEADIYNRFGEQLKGVIPDTMRPERAQEIAGVKPEQTAALQRLQDKAGKTGQEVVIMEAVGGNIDKADKRELDIKIGASTASRTELIASGSEPSAAMQKKVKMTAADLLRGSRAVIGEDRGYSLTGRTQGGENPDSSRFMAGRFSNANIEQMLNVSPEKKPQIADCLVKQLENIRSTMQKTDLTFVASSILITIDEKNPQNSVAKLIDLAHPVEPGNGTVDYKKLDAQFDHGLGKLIDLVKQSASPTA